VDLRPRLVCAPLYKDCIQVFTNLFVPSPSHSNASAQQQQQQNNTTTSFRPAGFIHILVL
jgi:hypothetical protein